VFRIIGNYLTYFVIDNSAWTKFWLAFRGPMYGTMSVFFAIRITRRFLGHKSWSNPFMAWKGLNLAVVQGSVIWAGSLYAYFWVKNWVSNDREFLSTSTNNVVLFFRPIIFIVMKKCFALMCSCITGWFDSPWMMHYIPLFLFMTLGYLSIQSISASGTWGNFVWFLFMNWQAWGFRMWRLLHTHRSVQKGNYIKCCLYCFDFLEWGRPRPKGDMHAPELRGWLILIEGYMQSVMLVMFLFLRVVVLV
jgi:hypothetical protein